MTELRRDIELRTVGPRRLLFDPLRHRYFLIAAQQLRALAGNVADDASLARARAEELSEARTPDASRELAGRAAARRESWWMSIAHRYLFLKIPLVRPDAWLERTAPALRSVPWRTCLAFVLCAALLAALLVQRRSDEVVGSLMRVASLESAVLLLPVLALLKSAHELGHAFALKLRGGRVPTMGVAFVVLFPILYTDTSDAWLLSRRRDRLAVDLAGVLVELVIAVFATWVWLVVPEGATRDIAFFVAAVSWTLSLAVNLNPFMRFDGYHVLADLLDIPNLQTRAFAFARWRLREVLFRPGAVPPEPMARARRRLLIVYAWTTWAYRLVLFTGIAILVYQMSFKLLGIALFLFEIWWFILRPVAGEVRTWRRFWRRDSPRSWLPVVLLLSMLALLAVPLDDELVLPAVLENGGMVALHSPAAGEVVLLRDGPVDRGDVVLRTRSAEAPFAQARVAARREAIASRSAHARGARLEHAVTADELRVVDGERKALIRAALGRTLVASAAGTVRLEEGVRPGVVLGADQKIGTIATSGGQVVAFADEVQAQRLLASEGAVFVPDATLTSHALPTGRMAGLPEATLPFPELSTEHGGTIRTKGGGKRKRPAVPLFAVRFGKPVAALPPGRWRGTVRVAARQQSYGATLLRRLRAVLLRESGF